MRNRTYDDEPQDVNMRGFTNKEIRKKFIRKVYCLLTVELCILFGFSAFGAFFAPLRQFVYDNVWTAFGISIGFIIGSMIPYYALVCYTPVRTKVPLNYIVFNIFVLMMSIGFMFLTTMYEPYVFLCGFGTTMALVIFLTLISFIPCVDVTGWGIYLLAISFVVGMFGTMAMLLYFFLGLEIIMLVYAGIVAVLSCLYIVFCTQLIIGGKKYELNPDEYILGCIMLFTHIVTLFATMMMLFNR